MNKSALVLACFAFACHGRRVQNTGDESPNSLQTLAGLLQSYQSPMNFGQAKHEARPASKDAALKAPSIDRRGVLGAGVATAAAALLPSQPANAVGQGFLYYFEPEPATLLEEFFKYPGKPKFANIIYKGGLDKYPPGLMEGFTETGVEGFKYKIIKAGSGPKPKKGQTVQVNYDGYAVAGKDLGSTDRRGKKPPTTFQVGLGRVMQGWDESLLDMNVGEVRAVRIPAQLAYGARGLSPSVKPNQDLFYKLELLKATDEVIKPELKYLTELKPFPTSQNPTR